MDAVLLVLTLLFVIAASCTIAGLWFQRHRRCRSCTRWTKSKYPYCPHCGHLPDVDFYAQPGSISPSLRGSSTLRSPKLTTTIPRSSSVTRLPEVSSSRSTSLNDKPIRSRRSQARISIDDTSPNMTRLSRKRVADRTEILPSDTVLPIRSANRVGFSVMPPRGRSIRLRPQVVVRDEDDVPTIPSRYKRTRTFMNRHFTCPSCHTSIHDHDDFCGNCGVSLAII